MTTTTRKANGHKAPIKRVVYHEFEQPTAPVPNGTAPIILDQRALAQLPVWRIVVLLSAIVAGVITLTWRVAAERATITDEITSIKSDVKALTTAVNKFDESVKELSGNLRHLSTGTWTYTEMVVFCKNLESQNAKLGFKCPAINVTTGALRN